jgi:alkyl hydroperoxide reductase subunit AhpC
MMHPADFTPVCTTEMAEASLRQKEFTERGATLFGFSCNDADSHRRWIKDIKHITGADHYSIPLFSDPTREEAVKLGLLCEGKMNPAGLPSTVRSVFVLYPDKTIAMTMAYPASMGLNFDEIIRAIDSLQMTVNMRVATPSSWKPGEDVIIDFPLSDKEADDIFGKGGYKIQQVPSEDGKDLERHYMRWAKDPSFG